jgi:chromosome segregation protein
MVKRLISLELQGYKTFATLTRLEFPGQVTAIVGPNGSGKSNIADSIRWVLGEQSYSLLRAKRTEDMIFSGSQHKSRAGMASASIIFNNEDGWLPIDYSEVSISRRAFRDGQNEYLLNGQKVRLKDITELLSQTGLSERTYTIIGQGLIDVALALRPDERSKLFEEAAGIGLYRSRKEESLRRLESTHKNLDRIKDILTEIRPRLRSLERQSKRYEEFQRLRSDLEALLKEWYGYHWHQKQQDLRVARQDYADQEKRLNTLRRKYAEAEDKVMEARDQLQKNRSEYEAAHSKLADYHRQLEQASRELAILDERRNSFNHQKSNLEIDIAHIEEEIKELESQKKQYQAEIDFRSSEFDAAADEMNTIKKKLTEISTKKTSAENKRREIRNERIAMETEKVQLTARVEELRNRVSTLTKEKTKIANALASTSQEKDEIQTKIGKLSDEIQSNEKDLSVISNDVREMSVRIEKLKKEYQDLDREISVRETERAKSLAQLDVLIQAEAALSGYSDSSKALVEESRKGHLPKGIEPLSKYLLVEEKYEKAIGVALGELSDLLIVPLEGKDIIIEYLESRDNDRVAMVVEGRKTSKRHQNGFSKVNGFIGYADEIVNVDSNYRHFADVLLSDILLVEDRRSALAIQPMLEGHQRAVTLQGLVIQSNGIMISGQSASGKKISRTRRQSEMREEIAALDEDLIRLEDKKGNLEKSLAELENTRNLHKNKHDEVEKNLIQLRQSFQREKDKQTRLIEQMSWHHERRTEIEELVKETNTTRQIDQERLTVIDRQIAEMMEEEECVSQEISEFPVFEIQQELNQWQTHRIVAENALKTSKQRYQDHQNRIEEAHQRLATHQSRIAEISESLSEIKHRREELKKKIDHIKQEIEIIENDNIKPLSAKGEQAEKSVSALEKLTEHSHKQVIVAERQFTQLELALDRRNDQLAHLKERIENDFGLVSYDYEQEIDGREPLPFENGLIERLPKIQELTDGIEDDIKRIKTHLRRIGSINPEAQREYFEVKERYEFLTEQIQDLEKASKDLQTVIDELDALMERDFVKTFKKVNQQFTDYFSRLFNGGNAKLLFSDEEEPVEGGVDIEARLPGRRSQGLALLSGGERSLTAVALIFALLKVSPTPFCILDEVDAMLDESNVGRFIDLLKELSQNTQFVIITHNRNTVQAADVIYGVTMGRDSTSQMISLKLEDVDETYLE